MLRDGRDGGRPGRVGPGAVAVFILLACVVVGALLGIGQRRGWFEAAPGASAPSPSVVNSPQSRRTGLDQALSHRSHALRERNRAAWLAGLDPSQPDLQAQQGTIFDNMGQLSFDLVTYDYTGQSVLSPERQSQLGPDAWVAKVNLSYRISGVDSASVRREQYVTMVRREGIWYIAGFDDVPPGATIARDPWELGPITVTRSSRSFIMSTSSAPQDELAARVDRGAQAVDAVWGDQWPRTVVIVVPEDQDQMASLLGRSGEDGLDNIAAVTTGEIGLAHSGIGADRVIVNPQGFVGLDATGVQIVLTHELTHVATRSSGTGDAPLWLSEGFADYVAYKGTGLSTWQRAGDLLGQVRQGQIPTRLPGAAEFDPASGNLAPAYSGAYLAVQLLVDQHGEQRVVELYRTVIGADIADGGTARPVPVEEAMPQLLHVDVATFEKQWVDYLKVEAAA